MKRFILTLIVMLGVNLLAQAQKVSVDVSDAPAGQVFADIMRQTGLNFVYPSGILDGLTVSVKAVDTPVREVLDRMFTGTDIRYGIRGRNVLLSRREHVAATPVRYVTLSGFIREAGSREALAGAVVTEVKSGVSVSANVSGFYSMPLACGDAMLHVTYPGYDPEVTQEFRITADMHLDFTLDPARELDVVEVVGSRNASIALDSPDPGHYHLTTSHIQSAPGIMGESDMVKALQMQPGISSGIEGLAGMYVHGGNVDENLYMLDNIPLYQVNHLAGLFSAFGALLRGRTTYLLSVRRSWQELLAWPILAIVNSESDEKSNFGYMFMDINAKVNHHFSDRSRAYVMFYYGHDRLNGGSELTITNDSQESYDKDDTHLRWGNTVLSLGWNYVLNPKLFGEFAAAYSHYGANMSNNLYDRITDNGQVTSFSQNVIKSDNDITDWILRADFEWHPARGHNVTFGGAYTRHSFLPSRCSRSLTTDVFHSEVMDSSWTYRANEFNAYAGHDWHVTDRFRVNTGLHVSLFGIDGHLRSGLSPRVSMRYAMSGNWSVKASYARAVQYVHQLTQSFISLPSDQWVPITGSFKPQRSDKLSAGLYHVSSSGKWLFSAEGYFKWLHNLVDYVDEYYLIPPQLAWDSRLTSGKGTARGLDLKLSKETGKLTGHVSYSLMWADRTFPDRNGGRTYPARFDNRHKIDLFLNWKASAKWEINAHWTGMTGNRFTLPTQMWVAPDFDGNSGYEVPLRTDINNYQLPFYHRLDLGFRRNTRHGFWNFSFYNAYCHMNVVSVQRGHSAYGWTPVFQQLHFLPIIPSFSYTWIF